jgi:hypothetical protein
MGRIFLWLWLMLWMLTLMACSNAAPPQVTNPLLDTMRTRSIVEPFPDSVHGTRPTPHITDTGRRTFKGTKQDSMRTEINPLYKGDNSDTALYKKSY